MPQDVPANSWPLTLQLHAPHESIEAEDKEQDARNGTPEHHFLRLLAGATRKHKRASLQGLAPFFYSPALGILLSARRRQVTKATRKARRRSTLCRPQDWSQILTATMSIVFVPELTAL